MEGLRSVYASSREQYQRDLAERVDAARAVTDPVERLAAAVNYWIHDWSVSNSLTPYRPFDSWLFSATFPEYWKSPAVVNFTEPPFPWNSRNIVAWFVIRARQAGLPTEDLHPLRSRGWIRKVPRGWMLGNVWVGRHGDIASVAVSTEIAAGGLRRIGDLLSIRHPDMAIGDLSPPVPPTATFEQWYRRAVSR
jgi:hypothetical protein